jgi:hypothetical protein
MRFVVEKTYAEFLHIPLTSATDSGGICGSSNPVTANIQLGYGRVRWF